MNYCQLIFVIFSKFCWFWEGEKGGRTQGSHTLCCKWCSTRVVGIAAAVRWKGFRCLMFYLPDPIIYNIKLCSESDLDAYCFISLNPIIYKIKLCSDPDLDAYCFISPDLIIYKIKLWCSDPDLDAYCFISPDPIIYKIKLWCSDPNLDAHCLFYWIRSSSW